MKTHWKKLDNPNYLGAYSLMKGEDKHELNVVIDKVIVEAVKSERGSEQCKVVYFQDHKKPMILNAVNSKTIAKLADSPYIEDWKGQPITLYVARLKVFGQFEDCLRIKDKAPVLTKPELLPTDKKNWDAVLQGLKNGYTIAQVKSKWNISEDNQELILSQAV